MQEHDRPVRTIRAVLDLARSNPGLRRVKIGDLELEFAGPDQSTQVSTHTAPAPGTDQKQKQVPEPSISDADLVLDVPKGMLVPVYGPDPEAN